MKKYISIFVLTVLCMGGTMFAQSPIVTNTTLGKATVFLDAAVLEHSGSFNIPKGTSEVVLRGVSNKLIEESLQVGATQGVTVMQVTFRTWKPTQEEVNDGATAVSREWLDAQTQLQSIQSQRKAINATLDLLSKGGNNTNATSLSGQQWEAWVDGYLQKQRKLLDELAVLTRQESDQLIIMDRLKAQGASSSTLDQIGEIVLQLQSDQARKAEVQLQYITNSARWIPEYELITKDNDPQMEIRFKASLRQQTGLYWKDIPLVLATSNPLSSSILPTLNPWFMDFYEPNVRVMGYSAKAMRSSDMAMMESTEVGYMGMDDYVQLEEGQMYNEYIIQLPVSMASSSMAQSLVIKSDKVPVKKEYLGIPKNSPTIYSVAKTESIPSGTYLPGSATIINNNKYVGKTTFNPSQFKDEFKVSLGSDTRIQVKREKISDLTSKKTFGSKKTDSYGFKLTAQNHKSQAVTMMLQEQVPVSTNKDLEITVSTQNGGQYDAEKGIITWEVLVGPGQSQSVSYTISLKYPSSKEVQELY